MLGLNVKDADHPQFWGSLTSEYLPISAVTKAGFCKTWDEDFAIWIMFFYYFLLSYSFKGRLDFIVKHSMQRAAQPPKLLAGSSEMLTYIKTLFSPKSWLCSEPGTHVMLFLACCLLLTVEWWLLRALHLSPGACSQSSPQPAMQVYRGVFPDTVQLLSCAVKKRRTFSIVWKVLSMGIWLLLSEKGAGLSLAFMLHSYFWVLSTQLSSHITAVIPSAK